MIFGIVGYGRFGKLWADALTLYGSVDVYDRVTISELNKKNVKITTLHEVAQADIVFILTPISLFEAACIELRNIINPSALVVDCCSVKMYPASVMQKIFSKKQSLIATHPLFGPDSVQKSGGLSGHKIVVCPIQCDEIKLNTLTTIFRKMDLNVLITTPEDHDKQMASSQGLVHFIGRGLAALELQQQELATPDFQALLNINKMVVNDTWQLFLDMHKYNPFTNDIRQKLIQQLKIINDEVNHANH